MKTALARSTTQPEIAHAHSNLGNRLLERFRLTAIRPTRHADHLHRVDSYDEPSYLLTWRCACTNAAPTTATEAICRRHRSFRTLLGCCPNEPAGRCRLGSAQTLRPR